MTVTCSVCGKQREAADTFSVENRVVCASCKPVFVQQISEGIAPELADVPPTAIPERPLGFQDILGLAWSIYRQRWAALAGMFLVPLIPQGVILLQMDFMAGISLGKVLTTSVLIGWIALGIGIAINIAGVFLVNAQIEGRPVSALRALRHGWKRWLRGLGTSLFAFAIEVLLSMLLVIPGLIWMAYYAFVLHAVALRRRYGSSALDYSKSLVSGNWWYAALRVAAFALIVGTPQVLLQTALVQFATLPVVVFLSSCVTCLLSSFAVVCTTVLFLNLEKARVWKRARPGAAVPTAPQVEVSANHPERPRRSRRKDFNY